MRSEPGWQPWRGRQTALRCYSTPAHLVSSCSTARRLRWRPRPQVVAAAAPFPAPSGGPACRKRWKACLWHPHSPTGRCAHGSDRRRRRRCCRNFCTATAQAASLSGAGSHGPFHGAGPAARRVQGRDQEGLPPKGDGPPPRHVREAGPLFDSRRSGAAAACRPPCCSTWFVPAAPS